MQEGKLQISQLRPGNKNNPFPRLGHGLSGVVFAPELEKSLAPYAVSRG